MYNMNNNNIIEVQRQESLKRRWHDSFYTRLLSAPTAPTNPTTSVASSSTTSQQSLYISKPPHHHHRFLQPGRLDGGGGDLVLNVVPSITVVLEGRSICHRINLQNHGNYQSLAKALRQMFVEIANIQQNDDENNNNNICGDNGQQQQQQLDLSNAVPGYVIAYEDMENDLLLAGDLQWKDFVRVAKRIRILPVKSSSRKQKSTKH
ncbi:auxin-responsive protein IAA33-like [Chenopodium quinoa]|uniref:auxin-responsive protein IAA33-like n=1 Tax=Chenopodium quinoa TaxID=63459 RepID=UPI000B7829D5|nr:auxin-responsive protein IAA33-like [Chenopodium quinoa]